MKKVLKFCSILFVLLLLTYTISFGASTVNKADATMKLVENNVCNITFGKYGEFEKKMIECNTTDKYVDISLTVKNKAEKLENKKANVVLLIDSSRSMSTNKVTINGELTTRKQAVLDASQTLITKLLEANPNMKIGVVEFATNAELNDEGYTVEGTEKDAKTVTKSLTNNKDTLKKALETVSKDTMGARTNIESGLIAADKLLATNKDEDTENYIILLTDAIPNTAMGVTMDTYTDKTAIPTKNKLLELKKSDVNVISMLIEMTDDEIEVSKEEPKPTYKQVAEKIFGTSAAPTSGEVLYVSDEEAEKTVTDKIYSSLIRESYELDNIVIKDYFPQNIIDNFKYAQLTKPSIGEITAEVDKKDNSITWKISKLEAGQTATFSYRIALNSTFDSKIVGINLPTNENVKITYEEDKVPGEKENDKCPIIALDVLPTKDIPQTGNYIGIYTATIISIIAVIAIVSYVYINRTKF